jgi:hypothetical protein
VKILRQFLRGLVRRQGEKLCCQRDNIAVLSATVTMKMCGIEFKARRFFLVKNAVYKTAPVRLQSVVLRRADKVKAFLDFVKNAFRFNRSFRDRRKTASRIMQTCRFGEGFGVSPILPPIGAKRRRQTARTVYGV